MPVSGRKFCRLLEKNGWQRRVKGSHHIYASGDGKKIAPVPVHGNKPMTGNAFPSGKNHRSEGAITPDLRGLRRRQRRTPPDYSEEFRRTRSPISRKMFGRGVSLSSRESAKTPLTKAPKTKMRVRKVPEMNTIWGHMDAPANIPRG